MLLALVHRCPLRGCVLCDRRVRHAELPAFGPRELLAQVHKIPYVNDSEFESRCEQEKREEVAMEYAKVSREVYPNAKLENE